MQVCTTSCGQTAPTASGRPFSPSQTTMHTSSTPRFLISVRTWSQYLAPSPPSPAHRPRMSRWPSTVTRQGHVDRPVGDLAVADLHVDGVDEDDRVDRVERPVLPFGHAVHDLVGDRGDRLLGHLGAVDLGQVRGDLPVRQPLRRQGQHHLVDAGQPSLPLLDDLRLEAGPPGRGARSISTGPISVSTVLDRVPLRELPPSVPGRVVLLVAEVVGDLALQGGLQHPLGQLLQQPALAGQLQPTRTGPVDQLPHQLLISRRQLRSAAALNVRHIRHWCLPFVMSYTVKITVPEQALECPVSGGVVGGVVVPAVPDDVEPGAGEDADGVGVVVAAGAGPVVEVGGPGAGVAGVAGEVADGVAELLVDRPAEGDGLSLPDWRVEGATPARQAGLRGWGSGRGSRRSRRAGGRRGRCRSGAAR